MNILTAFFNKWKQRIVLVGVAVLCLLPSLYFLKSNMKLRNTNDALQDSVVNNQITSRIMRTRLDTLTANNVKLRLELILNDCNSYKIHEKINAIPDDSLLVYADSILSKPILRTAGKKKGGNFGNTIKKLLGIPRAVLRPKTEGCSGECD